MTLWRGCAPMTFLGVWPLYDDIEPYIVYDDIEHIVTQGPRCQSLVHTSLDLICQITIFDVRF
eukprot:COSAG05_NODE_1452_length_4847_cov_3.384794_2_plen_63_part_00